jgi:hypothetical protein
MKKITFLLTLLSVFAFSYAQTFVSTTPANKNVILEEYTGKSCVYCPDGHRIAQELVANNPGRFFAINIHQGSYASGTPNYTTQWGNALAGQTGLTGYPSGTINRHVFSGTTTALSRSTWATNGATIMGQASPVNVAAQATIDWSTRILTVVVEVYYTGNATNSTNKLNVALLQNNILGPQTGGANFNPTMVVGSLYRHMHMLRDFLTGQWGVDITTTTTGSFFTQTFNYTIPADLNSIPIALEDLEILAYVAEGQQEILTGCEATITSVNAPAVYPRIDGLNSIDMATCDGEAGAYVTLKNVGSDAINSVQFSYTIAGGATQTYDWNARTIPNMATDTIVLPNFIVSTGIDQVLSIQVSQINGAAYTATAPTTLTINKKVANGGGYMSFKLVTDQYASETTFKIFNPDGSVLLQGGPWTDLGASGTTTRWFAFLPTQIGCYRLEVYDSYGDGINAGYGAGGFQLIKYDNTVLINNNGQFKSMVRYMINVDAAAGVEEATTNDVNVYPNPTDGLTNISVNLLNEAHVNVAIYNVYGQMIQVLNDSQMSQGKNDLTFNAANLSSGIYFVKVSIGNETYTKKVTVR